MQNLNFPVFKYIQSRKKMLEQAETRIEHLELAIKLKDKEIDGLSAELIKQRNVINKAQRLLKSL
jgi:uncharacterized coiled-coil protein SlyX